MLEDELRYRVKHTLRVSIGSALLVLLAQTSISSGCISSVFFFLATIPGSPEMYLGFQLRSILNAFLGVVMAAASAAFILFFSFGSNIAAFFLTLPFTVLFSALRTDASIVPLSVITTAFVGFLVISRFGTDNLWSVSSGFVIDSSVGLAMALIVNIPWADRAGDVAKELLAQDLRNAGMALSTVASRVFASSCTKNESRLDRVTFKPGISESDDCDHVQSSTKKHDEMEHIREKSIDPSIALSRSTTRWLSVLPLGATRVPDYFSVTRAGELGAGSAYEPGRWLGWRGFRNMSSRHWGELVASVRELISKVSSLESAIECTTGSAAPHETQISEKVLSMFLGDVSIPFWISHYALSAAACSAASRSIYKSRQSAMGHVSLTLDPTLDARSPDWLARRSSMYYGFLVQYRLYWKRLWELQTEDARAGSASRNSSGRGGNAARKQELPKWSELRALLFFSVSSQALAETLVRVQKAVDAVNVDQSKASWTSVFAPLRLPFGPVIARFHIVFLRRMSPWEVRFVVTNTLMLGTILAASLFITALERFDASEVAWVFSSAGLAAQLSAEHTAFIGLLRIISTIAGSLVGFGFNSLLALSSSRSVLYAQAPFFAATTFVVLLAVPARYRYASFLFLVTNGIVSFCPRSGDACQTRLISLPDSCLPDWRFALSRSINVSIGVVFALLFHLTFWPKFSQRDAKHATANVLTNGGRLFGVFLRHYMSRGTKCSGQNSKSAANKVPHHDGSQVSLSENNDEGATILPRPSSSVTTHSLIHEHRLVLQSVSSNRTIYGHPQFQQDVSDLVGTHVSAALRASAEASKWVWSGPLALPPVLRVLPTLLVTVEVSLSEMASVLGRRPVFSQHGEYLRTAHSSYVSPLQFEYQTLIIALQNVAAEIGECVVKNGKQDSYDDLRTGVQHVENTMVVVQSRACALRRELHESLALSDGKLVRREVKRLRPSFIPRQRSMCALNAYLSQDGLQPEGVLKRSSSMEMGSEQLRTSWLDPDDVVLYNAFHYAVNAVVSSFLNIANTVLAELKP